MGDGFSRGPLPWMGGERFEVCDATTDDTDPRFKVWDRQEHCYLPGYWKSEDDARRGAKTYEAIR